MENDFFKVVVKKVELEFFYNLELVTNKINEKRIENNFTPIDSKQVKNVIYYFQRIKEVESKIISTGSSWDPNKKLMKLTIFVNLEDEEEVTIKINFYGNQLIKRFQTIENTMMDFNEFKQYNTLLKLHNLEEKLHIELKKDIVQENKLQKIKI